MVAQVTPVDPPTLIEVGLKSVASLRGRRRKKEGPSALQHLWASVSGLVGTIFALACFVIAAFMFSTIVGFLVLGVCLLLLDTKVAINRRTRASVQQRR